MTGRRILCISFSPLQRDARVRRQIAVLREFGDVTTLGYGPAPEESSDHLEVPHSAVSLPQTAAGIAKLALRRHKAVELTSPGERAGIDLLAGTGKWDLVVANDARALPLAFATAKGAPVWADLHEWAPQENSSSLAWRILVAPYMDALCRRYLVQAAAVSTVGAAIADLYTDRYGIFARVVRNALPDQRLTPSEVDPQRIRLVHSGVAARERNIEALIDAAHACADRFELDLFLVGDEGGYLTALRERAARTRNVRVLDPVPAADLPTVLNAYDLGVYVLPLRSLNHRLMLPNKFFDFVQARLGLVFGSSEELDRLIADHGLGRIVPRATADDLASVLKQLTAEEITRFKHNAHRAAAALSNDSDIASQRALVTSALGKLPRA